MNHFAKLRHDLFESRPAPLRIDRLENVGVCWLMLDIAV
jgi:hypothetical protein